MKVKKYILIIAIVLTMGISYVGASFACDGGGPPPDTASVQIESPAVWPFTYGVRICEK